ncbi:MAG: hypothetical protein ACOYIE_00455 [Agathobaculum sp.]|jgi:hypothetical protein|uniref:hypothetical protein n=1 Tax=Agathobaculum sp. TaxID=2048138 RepID=UPI003D941761
MRERLFPRWGAALFALLPLSEILYVSVNGQTMYAAALASLVCALICAAGAQIAPLMHRHPPLRWVLALAALWPLTRSFARMALFLRSTVFTGRPLWSLVLLLTVCAVLLAASGLNRCAMWAMPAVWTAGIILVLSGILTLGDLRVAYWQPPDGTLLPLTGQLLSAMLPGALTLSLSLPDKLSGAASRGLAAGGALFALISLRALLLLGPHTAALLPYPNFSAAGLAAIGDFARRGEVFFAVPLLLCELGRAAALCCVLFFPLTHTYGVPHIQKKDA